MVELEGVSAPSSVIDVHTHVVPDGLPFGHDDRFARSWPRGDTADVMVGGCSAPCRARRGTSTPASRRWTTAGSRMQAVSVMPELFSYWAEPDLGRSFCRGLNQAIATMAAGAPDRLVGLGTVPLQDVDAAIAALDEVRDARSARRRDRLERPRRDHRRDQLPARSSRRRPSRVSACSSTRSTRPTGTASPIHRWRRR